MKPFGLFLALTLVSPLAACGGSDASAIRVDLAPALAAAPEAFFALSLDGDALRATSAGDDTPCADGARRRACPCDDLDLDRADLTREERELAVARLRGGSAIARGKLVSDGARAHLVVSRVFLRDAYAPTLELAAVEPTSLHRLRDDRGACVEARSCAWLRVEPLGDPGGVTHARGLELGAMGEALEPHASAALTRGELVASGASVGGVFTAVSLYVPYGASTAL